MNLKPTSTDRFPVFVFVSFINKIAVIVFKTNDFLSVRLIFDSKMI